MKSDGARGGDRTPLGRPKKTWSKIMEEDMRKLKLTEGMAEDRH